jgi:hypothetical protein
MAEDSEAGRDILVLLALGLAAFVAWLVWGSRQTVGNVQSAVSSEFGAPITLGGSWSPSFDQIQKFKYQTGVDTETGTNSRTLANQHESIGGS